MVKIVSYRKNVKILTHAWNGDIPLNLSFPNDWNVKLCEMVGHNNPEISDVEILDRINNPEGTNSLREVASGHDECVIIVNDSCRPFRHENIVPIMLKELCDAGIKNNNIRFVIGSGAHSWTTLDIIKKMLGYNIPNEYLVFNHNCYENNVFVGKTSRNTNVYANKEVMGCDLKISLHGILPHELAGFGGGSKIVLPGISSIETIAYNHRNIYDICKGKISENEFLLDLEEGANIVGIDFIINQIINGSMKCSDLICGDVISAHRAGSKIARNHYSTEIVNDADIVIVNSYPMDYEPYKALYGDIANSVKSGGHVVVLAHDPRGLRGHYLTGRFGRDYGSRMWDPNEIVKDVESVIVVSPYHSLADEAESCGTNSIWVEYWNEALDILMNYHDDPVVAVYPTASIQMSEDEASKE